MLILALALTAQPLESRIGPRPRSHRHQRGFVIAFEQFGGNLPFEFVRADCASSTDFAFVGGFVGTLAIRWNEFPQGVKLTQG
jgi:hypothetical protein